MQVRLDTEPLSTGAAHVYPYSDHLCERFVALSRFDDPYPLHRVFGSGDHKRIAIPRNLGPVSSNDLRDFGHEVKFTSSFVPRNDEQARVVSESYEYLRQGQSFITEAPTGFGKTWCAMDTVAKVGRRTLVIVTKEDILDQWVDAACAVLGLTKRDIGIIKGDRCDTLGKPISIGLVQSVSKFGRYSSAVFKGIGLTIFDEVHRMGADVFSNACYILPSLLRWGLSATPNRSDGKEQLIKANIGRVQVRTKHAPLVPIIYRARSDVSFPRGLKQRPGRTAHFDRIIARNMKRNHFIARFVRTCYRKQRRVIVFSATKAHLEWLHAAIKKVGIPAKDMAYYVGGLTKQDREAAKYQPVILATYAFTSEATDIPWLDAMVMATPRSDVVQITGRILREYPDKKVPIVLDIVDPLRMFENYSKKRSTFYNDIGAEIRRVNYD
jgi:superfamily II DNA or RNA helicase